MIEELWNGLIEFSEQFVIPDWGELVALIPLGLAALVVLFLAWTIWRFATAGPTRRGKRRLPPAAPAGIHMPGPSFAPLLAAAGAFFLVFGVVAGGAWLWVGGVILVITLLYWGREEMRDFDRGAVAGAPAAAAGTALIPAGPLPAPRGTPPEGVHVPPPSFRPLLISIAATILVAGLVVGGWLAVVGFVAVVLTGLGWLRDARREYVAAETADRTGHLDLGGPPAWPKATLAALALLVVVGAVASSGLIGGGSGGAAAASGEPGASAPAAGGGAPSGEAPAAPDADVVVTAKGAQWVEKELAIPADASFSLAFDNKDPGMPHDVVIRDAGGAVVWKSELVTGPAVVVYDVPAIPAGQYAFVCTVHPNMTGTVTAQ